MNLPAQGYTVWHTSRMSDDNSESSKKNDTAPAEEVDDNAKAEPKGIKQVKEIGGRDGPDPTRYGDWEKAGRCIDF